MRRLRPIRARRSATLRVCRSPQTPIYMPQTRLIRWHVSRRDGRMVHQGGSRNPYHPGRRAPRRPVHPGPSRIILLPSGCGPDLDAVASQTPHYVQVVGFIDQVKIDMLPDDYGGEMVSQNLPIRASDRDALTDNGVEPIGPARYAAV